MNDSKKDMKEKHISEWEYIEKKTNPLLYHFSKRTRFEKIRVLIIPNEKEKIESFAKKLRLDIVILPRIGISHTKSDGPTQILAYQLMGKESNGNTCPFLDTESDKR